MKGKTTNKTYLCNGYEVRTIIKNCGHKPHNETTMFFNIDDLSEAMGWDNKFRKFLLIQDARNKNGYMKENEIEECIQAYCRDMSDWYNKWRKVDINKSPDDFIFNDKMKEILKDIQDMLYAFNKLIN